jgi:molybdate transport system permease protein
MLGALYLSLQLALLCSAILLILGMPLAYVLIRSQFWGKRFVETLILLPITLPPTVLGFYLLLLLGANGPLVRLFNIRWAFSFEGMLLGSVIFSLPFALTAYREAVRGLDNELFEAARSMGANLWQLWRYVILPLAWPGMLSGTLLAFAHTLGEFGVILMIGGSIPGRTRVLSIYIYDLVQTLRFQEASLAAGILFIVSFGILYIIRTLEDTHSRSIR